MAGWITHLRIAEGLADLIGRERLDLEKFYVGSIAPDGGVPTDIPDVYVPPKSITHLGTRGSRDYAGFEAKYLTDSKSLTEFSFCLGYYFHVLTDEWWGTYIYFPEIERYLGDFPDRQGFNRAMKDNWEALDLDFVKQNPEYEPYRTLAELPYFENTYLEAFPNNAFGLLLGRFREFYAQADGFSMPELKYLSRDEHNDFIKNCIEYFYNAYFNEKYADALYKITKICYNNNN